MTLFLKFFFSYSPNTEQYNINDVNDDDIDDNDDDIDDNDDDIDDDGDILIGFGKVSSFNLSPQRILLCSRQGTWSWVKLS